MDVATLTNAQPQIVYGVTFCCYRLAPVAQRRRPVSGRPHLRRTPLVAHDLLGAGRRRGRQEQCGLDQALPRAQERDGGSGRRHQRKGPSPGTSRLLLEIDVGERLPVGVTDDEARAGLLDGPGRREVVRSRGQITSLGREPVADASARPGGNTVALSRNRKGGTRSSRHHRPA
jgi:hypothetical protein